MTGDGKRTYNIMALQRGLKLLSLFAKAEGGLTATQVAKLSGLPISTVHRFLMNLDSSGFVTSSGNGSYHLGIACFSLGQSALGHLGIRRLSLPWLQELNRLTRETIHLTVRHELSAVYVEKLDSPEPLRIFSRIGASVALHCTAVGKVLLAFLPQEELTHILPQIELKRSTQNTLCSLHELQTELQRVRRVGHACDLEENELHIRCIAAPIWDHIGVVNPSLSVTGPVVRMPVARLRQLAPLVMQAGLRISRELGFQAPAVAERNLLLKYAS
jgi:DNA-binding IclR family transcriptional regulator